ncbi:hypothetical protein [Legionella norrlandica]|uniref:hypothetical protein n=1 Tax=Legionella norrlandica TaxID=1498499 RepID=UPI001F4CFEE5|nr:hypothetical protein [Legionella norrlandica]
MIPQKIGCCGMAGAYGLKTMHQVESRGLFDLSWKNYFKDNSINSKILVDGYSCRIQAQRFSGFKAQHPIEILLNLFE